MYFLARIMLRDNAVVKALVIFFFNFKTKIFYVETDGLILIYQLRGAW